MTDIPQEWVEKGAQILGTLDVAPLFPAHRRHLARAVLAALLPDIWPCDNYQAPLTCLTAPCAKGSECDFCRAQAEAGRRAVAEEIAAAINYQLVITHEYDHDAANRPGLLCAARIARSLASPTDRDG